MTAQVVTLGATTQQNGISNFASGSFATDSGTAADYAIYLGFTPRYVKVWNVTDLLMYEKFDTNAAGVTFLTTGSTGVVTVSSSEAGDIQILSRDTNDLGTAVSLVSDPGLVRGGEHTNAQGGLVGGGFNMDEDIMVASKSFIWIALG